MSDEDNFDEAELITERHLVSGEITQEFNDTTSLRAEGLLLTNYVDNLLKDCIVYLFRSKESRGIDRKLIVRILHEKGIINDALRDDIRRIFDIRDQYGHTMRRTLIAERVEPILERMEVTKELKKLNPTWDTFETMEKLSKISISIISELEDAFSRMNIDNALEKEKSRK